jgi:hypothetical protein
LSYVHTSNSFKISVLSSEKGRLNLRFFALNSEVIFDKDFDVLTGLNDIELNKEIKPGIYFVSFSDTYNAVTQKIIIAE